LATSGNSLQNSMDVATVVSGEAASHQSVQKFTRVAIAGLGAIGSVLAKALDQGAISSLRLTAVSAGNLEKAQRLIGEFQSDVIVAPLTDLADHADLVIECAPAAVLGEVLTPFLIQGKIAVVLSVGGLLQRPNLVALAQAHGAQIAVPSGALLGLDAVLAAAEGEIQSVRLSSRKPPRGLAGAPHLIAKGIVLDGLTQPLCVFNGTALEAVRGFPANVNVVAALALAGIGAERTEVEIWADPTITRNVHSIKVISDAATFSTEIENIPSTNPKTSRIVAQSILALLRKRFATLQIGS
jgi:aspartate dehydrogenase